MMTGRVALARLFWVTLACATSLPAMAQFGVYNLRTDPAVPAAGQAFSGLVCANAARVSRAR
jgi:hypothetical protein